MGPTPAKLNTILGNQYNFIQFDPNFTTSSIKTMEGKEIAIIFWDMETVLKFH